MVPTLLPARPGDSFDGCGTSLSVTVSVSAPLKAHALHGGIGVGPTVADPLNTVVALQWTRSDVPGQAGSVSSSIAVSVLRHRLLVDDARRLCVGIFFAPLRCFMRSFGFAALVTLQISLRARFHARMLGASA